ncbi:unnamed protein product [Closterium sp. Naga37s-1]|nr:unnamed protein product [Closterium sp. Naga37s-1]
MNDERRNAATGGAPWRRDTFHLSGGPYHSPEEGRRRRDERGRWRGREEQGGGEAAGGMHAGESPDEPDGAGAGESAPTHEAADSCDEAEEDEGVAERESRRDDPDRHEGHRASHAAQQERPAQVDDVRELQLRGSRGGEETERSRTSDELRRQAEQHGARQPGEGRGHERQTPRGGGRRGESRSPERQWHQRGASRSPRQQRRWHQRPREESRSPVRGRGREGRRDEREAHLSASGGTEGAKGDGRHPRCGVQPTRRVEREEREAATRRQGIGSGRRGTAGIGGRDTGEGGATKRARPGAWAWRMGRRGPAK